MARSSWSVQAPLSWKREWPGRSVIGYLQVAGNGRNVNRALSAGLGKREVRWISGKNIVIRGALREVIPGWWPAIRDHDKDGDLQLDEVQL